MICLFLKKTEEKTYQGNNKYGEIEKLDCCASDYVLSLFFSLSLFLLTSIMLADVLLLIAEEGKKAKKKPGNYYCRECHCYLSIVPIILIYQRPSDFLAYITETYFVSIHAFDETSIDLDKTMA